MSSYYGSLPFQQQIDFFRSKNLVASDHYLDLQRDAHDTGFMVAGATKAELLADLKAAIQKAINDGTTLAQFRKDFDSIVEKHGWTGWTGSENAEMTAWRTRIIYETNLRTSYQAGRWQQIQAVKKHRPYLQYRHSRSVLTPREDHLSWDGLVVPVDSDWVKTHFPPNGYGCKCKMFALSKADLKRLGKTKPDTPPDEGTYEWTDKRTGETHTFPKGIQPFWDYTPGASTLAARTREQLDRTLQGLPTEIGTQLLKLIKLRHSGTLFEQMAFDLGVKKVNYGAREDIAKIVNQGLAEMTAHKLALPDNVRVDSALFEKFAALENKNAADYAAVFVPHTASGETHLFLNPLSEYWRDPGLDARKQFKIGEWSTDGDRHVFNHEIGHLQHYLADKANYLGLQVAELQPSERLIAKQVSFVAQTSPIEFVAEVFAGLLTGRSYNADIMNLYITLKGHIP